jgi:membrane protease YdiL (CAAX protease family)
VPVEQDPAVRAQAAGAAGSWRERWAALIALPPLPPAAADLRMFRLGGIELPVRATSALFFAVFLVLFDYERTFIPAEIEALGLTAGAARYQALERVILFGVVPLLVVLFLYRDRPARYGLRLGDWRIGLPLAVLGCALLTPIVAGLAGDPVFRSFYARIAAPVPDLIVTYVLDIAPTEFLIRGFLMFTLIRSMGPIGIVVAQLPFVFSHINKPEIELFSTMFGGLAYGWLNWRTGSILWSVIAHVYILTLAIVLSAPAVAS